MGVYNNDGSFRVASLSDPMAQVIRHVRSTYGDVIDPIRKRKTLNKFGRTLNADNNVKTTVGQFQGTVVNETYATTNSIDYIVSDSASDTESIKIEGHAYDSDNNKIFTVQSVTLTGQTPVALGTPLCRATRAVVNPGTFASPASDLVGDVYIYDSTAATGVTAGVPDVAAATKLMILGTAGINQSQKCSTTISSSDYWIITHVTAGVEKGNSSTVSADIEVEYREQGGVWLPLGLEMTARSAATSFIDRALDPYLVIAKNTDVRMVVTTNTNDTTAAGKIAGVLASVVE